MCKSDAVFGDDGGRFVGRERRDGGSRQGKKRDQDESMHAGGCMYVGAWQETLGGKAAGGETDIKG